MSTLQYRYFNIRSTTDDYSQCQLSLQQGTKLKSQNLKIDKHEKVVYCFRWSNIVTTVSD